MKKNIYNVIVQAQRKGKKFFSVLIDPDKFNIEVIHEANEAKVDFIFIGGSGLKKDRFLKCVNIVKRNSQIPLVIFPGGKEQISDNADGILLLSLISGRNPDYLIGEHIRAAKQLRKSKLEIIPTGYILVNGGKKIATQKVSRTKPIGYSDNDLAASTAIAGELLGMQLIYLEAGSGAKRSANKKMISNIKKNISIPLIVGGGITSAKTALACCKAGADMIVVGNAIEKDISLVKKISNTIYSMKK